MAAVRNEGDKVCHSWTSTCQTASKAKEKKEKRKKDPRFQGKVSMHIVSSTGLRGKTMKLAHAIRDDSGLEGSDGTELKG